MAISKFEPEWREEDRLAALADYDILDSFPEAAFDDIVRIAASICDMPMALISLVDDRRQWFKAAIGLDASETSREIAFCAKAIQQPNLFMVPDATADPRFADNPLVTGDPDLRFYAGAVLETPEGLPLGTLCVLDRKPRTLTDAQQDALKALARQVMAQLELRKALAKQRRDEEHRKLLTNELEHRIKNTLSVVQAIVSQSLRGVATPAEARDAIGDRLAMLGRAHDLLTQTSWMAAPIDAVVETATQVYAGRAGRIRTSGPAVPLAARSALALSMALHELSTNAAKYGALSTGEGHIDIVWSIDESGGGATILTLEWREHGGPPVLPPARRGFGTRLIETNLSRDLGKAELDYAPEGLRWTMRARLADIQDTPVD